MWKEAGRGLAFHCTLKGCISTITLRLKCAASHLRLGLSHVTALHHYCPLPCRVVSFYNCIRGEQSTSLPCEYIVLLVAACGDSHHSFKRWCIDLSASYVLIKAKQLSGKICHPPSYQKHFIFLHIIMTLIPRIYYSLS